MFLSLVERHFAIHLTLVQYCFSILFFQVFFHIRQRHVTLMIFLDSCYICSCHLPYIWAYNFFSPVFTWVLFIPRHFQKVRQPQCSTWPTFLRSYAGISLAPGALPFPIFLRALLTSPTAISGSALPVTSNSNRSSWAIG